MDVTTGSDLSDTEKVRRIRALLANSHIAESLDPNQIDELKATVVSELSEDDYYLILAAKSVRLQSDGFTAAIRCRKGNCGMAAGI